MEHHRQYIEHLVAKTGPEPNDYPQLDAWLSRVHDEVAAGLISPSELSELRSAFGEALSPATLQGLALCKPHGYAGDFEIIDGIYREHVSPKPRFAAWDRYFHQQAATKAVRNRKTYFHRVLDGHYARRQPLRVLNIASGPGRCMFEWLSANPSTRVSFHCVEIDPKAIEYASQLNREFLGQINFARANALKYAPTGQFDLIWASGIFDYFANEVFQALLRRLITAVAPGGELVIGNFSTRNPSRPYMEVMGDWMLHHRTAETLGTLARGCEVAADAIHIGSEPEGVNLFLHIRL